MRYPQRVRVPRAACAASTTAVQRALATGSEPSTLSHLVEDVTAEANVISALVCHADGMNPKSVCGRPMITDILKHVK
jgi:hypothetical protein